MTKYEDGLTVYAVESEVQTLPQSFLKTIIPKFLIIGTAIKNAVKTTEQIIRYITCETYHALFPERVIISSWSLLVKGASENSSITNVNTKRCINGWVNKNGNRKGVTR